MNPCFAALLLLIVPLALTVNAYEFKYSNEPFPKYERHGFRSLPYSRIGIYSQESATAKARADPFQPFVRASLTIRNASKVPQLVVYRYEGVERSIMKHVPESTHVCSDAGQAYGAGTFRNLTGQLYTFDGQAKPDERNAWTINRIFYTSDTGLYIISLNMCEYSGSGSSRVLDTSTTGASIDGVIEIKNPFGWMPGQAYGFLPCYTILFVLIIILLIVLGIGFALAGGRKRIVAYHLMFVWTGVVTLAAYLMIIMYFWIMNNSNTNVRALWFIAQLLVAVRSTASRLTLFCVAYGYMITKQRLNYWGAVAGAGTVHFILQVIFVIVTEWTNSKSTTAMTVIDMREDLVGSAIDILSAIVEILVGIAIALALWRTIKGLGEKETVKRKTYWRMVAVLVVYVIVCVLWWIYATLFNVPGSLNESQWEFWWMHVVMWDFFYILIFSAMLAIWFPRKSTNHLQLPSYADDAAGKYASIGGGNNRLAPRPGTDNAQQENVYQQNAPHPTVATSGGARTANAGPRETPGMTTEMEERREVNDQQDDGAFYDV